MYQYDIYNPPKIIEDFPGNHLYLYPPDPNLNYWLDKEFLHTEEYAANMDIFFKQGYGQLQDFTQATYPLVEIYQNVLYYMLISPCIPVYLSNNELVFINGLYYQKLYFRNFYKGIAYFEENFPVPTNLYDNGSHYIKDILTHYTGSSLTYGQGWGYYRSTYPDPISVESIERWGFYAGIIHKIEQLAAAHSSLFREYFSLLPGISQPDNSADNRKDIVTGDKHASNALFYYYTHFTGEIPPPEAGKQTEFYEQAARGKNPKNFQKKFNLFAKKENRLEYALDIEIAIKKLHDYPKALAMAKEELEEAKPAKKKQIKKK